MSEKSEEQPIEEEEKEEDSTNEGDADDGVTLKIIDASEPWREYEGDSFPDGDSVLSASARNKMSKSSFADPENEAYPVNDVAHARNALTRFLQFGRRKYQGEKRRSVAGKILRACKKFGVKVSDEVRKRLMGDSSGWVEQASTLSTRGLYRASLLFHEEAKMLGVDVDSMEDYLAVKYELERRYPKKHTT